MRQPRIKMLTTMSLLIATEIILTRFFSINTGIIRIGFGFLPIAIMAVMYGPIRAGSGAVVANLLGVALFPSAFFPGFTLTAFLTGVVYGLVLYNRRKSMLRVIVAVLIVTIILNLGLDTLWLLIMGGTLNVEGFLAIVLWRILRTLIMTPIQIILILAVTQGTIGKLIVSHSSR